MELRWLKEIFAADEEMIEMASMMERAMLSCILEVMFYVAR